MKRLTITLFLFATSALPAHSTPIIADVSSHEIEIHSAFTGAQLLLFGARNGSGDIIIIIRGPDKQFTVRKKENVSGIWINKERYTFDPLPEFYAIATSRPFEQIPDHLQFKMLGIGASDLLHEGIPLEKDHFASALLRKLKEEQLYSKEPIQISFISETLFRTVIDFPDRLPRGTYTAEIYLISDGEIVGVQTIPIDVYKTGFDAFMYDLAKNKSPLYALFAIFLAYLAGWSAYTIFQRLR